MASKEGRIQAECIKWFRNEYYKNQKSLFAVFNEGANVGGKISLGLQPGVPDLLLYERGGRGLIGIEMKCQGESHNVQHVIRQAQWILDVCNMGGFVDNLPQFQKIITGDPVWFDPMKVINYLYTIKTKSFVWDGRKFT